jgi:hypothetical protein
MPPKRKNAAAAAAAAVSKPNIIRRKKRSPFILYEASEGGTGGSDVDEDIEEAEGEEEEEEKGEKEKYPPKKRGRKSSAAAQPLESEGEEEFELDLSDIDLLEHCELVEKAAALATPGNSASMMKDVKKNALQKPSKTARRPPLATSTPPSVRRPLLPAAAVPMDLSTTPATAATLQLEGQSPSEEKKNKESPVTVLDDGAANTVNMMSAKRFTPAQIVIASDFKLSLTQNIYHGKDGGRSFPYKSVVLTKTLKDGKDINFNFSPHLLERVIQGMQYILDN